MFWTGWSPHVFLLPHGKAENNKSWTMGRLNNKVFNVLKSNTAFERKHKCIFMWFRGICWNYKSCVWNAEGISPRHNILDILTLFYNVSHVSLVTRAKSPNSIGHIPLLSRTWVYFVLPWGQLCDSHRKRSCNDALEAFQPESACSRSKFKSPDEKTETKTSSCASNSIP